MILRFDDWMQRCLYDPQKGYYARRVQTVGAQGDFTTTPELSLSLARAITDWIQREWQHHGAKLPIIEIGAGSGQLSAQVRQTLGWRGRIGLQHAIVEVSDGLRIQQRKLMGNKVRWFEHIADALQHYEGRALIYSNELVDAFPVRVFRREEAGWSELSLQINQGDVTELWQDSKELPESTVLQQSYPVGQRVEVHESYATYLSLLAKSWSLGSLLTIDYGDEVDGLYYRRPQGSIRGYFMQQRMEGAQVYQNMGRQDLTADVNFSDLVGWSHKCGITTHKLISQAEFLNTFMSANDLVDTQLNSSFGAGEAFRVLLQRKNIIV